MQLRQRQRRFFLPLIGGRRVIVFGKRKTLPTQALEVDIHSHSQAGVELRGVEPQEPGSPHLDGPLEEPYLLAPDLDPSLAGRLGLIVIAAAGELRRHSIGQVDLLYRTPEIIQVVEVRLYYRPDNQRRQGGGNRKDEPVLVEPAPARIARNSGLAAQAHLALQQVIDMSAHRLSSRYRDHVVPSAARSVFQVIHLPRILSSS